MIKQEIKDNKYIYTNCSYNVIFCTKYRRKLLEGEIAQRLTEIIDEVALKVGFSVDYSEIKPDYVSLIISCDPELGVLKCLREVKGTSSNILRKEFHTIKSRVPSLWTRYAYIATCGSGTDIEIDEFIKKQKEH